MEGIKEFFFTFEGVEEAIEKLRGFLEREFEEGRKEGRKEGRIYPSFSSSLSSQIKSYIDKNFTHIRTVRDIAEALGISESTVYRHFSNAFGISPGKYIRILKLEYALHLRKNGYLLKEIMDMVGYSSPSSLSRALSSHKLLKKERKRCSIALFLLFSFVLNARTIHRCGKRSRGRCIQSSPLLV
ncbi:hypothetical protein DRQ18_02595 [bacterium]|nr:MAG: hypothetical protein DRQ18_02595 [bacterium]